MKHAAILALITALVSVSSLSAYEPPDYPYCRRIEEASLQARETGLPGPYLFGIEVIHPFFGISLTAIDG